MRVHELVGRVVYDAAGVRLGRVVDAVTEPDGQGRPRVTGLVVAPHWPGRLLGYERRGARGPWLLDRVAKWLYRGCREVPWPAVRLQRV